MNDRNIAANITLIIRFKKINHAKGVEEQRMQERTESMQVTNKSCFT